MYDNAILYGKVNCLSYSGATVVGIKFDNGVVIAGERKVTYGTFIISTKGKKVYLLEDNIGIGIAGMIADMQEILRILREEIRYYKISVKQPIRIDSVAKLVSNILYSYKLFPMLSEILLGGIDVEPKLVVMDPLGSTIIDNYATVGTGAQIAIGVLEEEYKENMNEQQAKELAVKSIKTAMKRDALSGGTIDVVVIGKEKSYEESFQS